VPPPGQPQDPQWPGPPQPPVPEGKPDASGWHWLLWLPIVLPLLPFLYNRRTPELIGLPFFYWAQLVLALLSAITIAIVHVATKGR
jgi:uncharacterized protein DUF3311